MQKFFRFLCILFGIYLASKPCSGYNYDFINKLVILSFDGLRFDAISPGNTPTLWKIRSRGTHANRLIGVFPTKTFPNHYSVATGLYPEYHGVVASNMFDSQQGKEINYSKELFQYNKDVIPLWTLNEMNGGKSACLMWPGSEFIYHNLSCSFTKKYSGEMSLNEMANTAIDWLANAEKSVNLVMMYINQPDRAGHIHGFASEEYNAQLRAIDEMVSLMFNVLAVSGLIQQMNFAIISDHGMTNVTRNNIVNLTEGLDPAGNYRTYASSPVLQIVPEEGKMDYVLEALRKYAEKTGHFQVYHTDTLPIRWHVNNTRFGPIVAVANYGYAFQDLLTNIINIHGEIFDLEKSSTFGLHGYDNLYREMDGIFIAWGPFFGRSKVAEKLNTIDLFDMFCHILNIENIPPSNGSMECILTALFERSQLECIAILFTISLMFVLFVLLKVACIIFARRKPYIVWK